MGEGGMSFEQRKRVSIAVELAANPSILFLDEPTTGLDSRAAQALIRNIQTIAKTGRAIVCTIHQPSTAIFNAFTSLLLLKRGGQTVYFGELGYHSENLVQFFQAAPNVSKMPISMNPATWMLEVIGAGTSVAAASANSTITDFHIHYNQSALCELNLSRLDHFIRPNEGSKKVQTWTQFRLLMHRIALTYWRTSTYSLFRHFTYVIIALIFASAYLPNQKYETYVAATSRAAVIYIYYSFVLWYFIDVNKFRSGKNVMKELGEISIINPEKNEIRTYMYIGFLSK
jgi:energy-coupling factor transporter ATP-binding protein EcfA2